MSSTDEYKGAATNDIIRSTWEGEAVDRFEDMGLKPELLRGLYAIGFEQPSVVQRKAMMPMIQGRNVIAHDRNGAGKSSAYIISTLQQVDASLTEIQAIILAPTREVARQVHTYVSNLGQYLDILCYCCVGGSHLKEVTEGLQEDAHIVVGTPGRVFDMIQRGVLKTESIRILCLDEASELFARGCEENINGTVQILRQDIQIISAITTVPSDVPQLLHKIMPNSIYFPLEG